MRAISSTFKSGLGPDWKGLGPVDGGCPYVFVKRQAGVDENSLGSSFLGVPRSRPACAGRLRFWALCGDGAWRDFAEELLVFQHCVETLHRRRARQMTAALWRFPSARLRS